MQILENFTSYSLMGKCKREISKADNEPLLQTAEGISSTPQTL